MTYLENSKQYTGSDLENIFFRPILTGDSAQELGVRVLYNMPQSTHIQLWDGQRNILQKFTSAGWAGGTATKRVEKAVGAGHTMSICSAPPPTRCSGIKRILLFGVIAQIVDPIAHHNARAIGL